MQRSRVSEWSSADRTLIFVPIQMRLLQEIVFLGVVGLVLDACWTTRISYLIAQLAGG